MKEKFFLIVILARYPAGRSQRKRKVKSKDESKKKKKKKLFFKKIFFYKGIGGVKILNFQTLAKFYQGAMVYLPEGLKIIFYL